MEIRGPYTPVKVSGWSSKLPTMTKQSMRDECDINKIMERYQRTGLIEHINENAPRYEDMPLAADFQEAMGIIAAATTTFEELPATIRDQFDNDPSLWLDFIHDAESVDDQMKALGLRPERVRARPEAQPVETPDNPDTPESGSQPDPGPTAP